MSEEKKDSCCSGGASGGCCGVKKIVVAVILALVIFTCGYIFGKGHCPFAGGGTCKTCPMMQH